MFVCLPVSPCSYNPRAFYEKNPELMKALDQIGEGFFCPGEPKLFESLVDHLLNHDTYAALHYDYVIAYPLSILHVCTCDCVSW